MESLGGEDWIRTSEALRATDLQSVPINRSGTSPNANTTLLVRAREGTRTR